MTTALSLIGTCPTSRKSATGADYLERVRRIARWADEDNWEALLIYTSNKFEDPWQIAQCLIQMTSNLSPLVAVQPLYCHPFTIARAISSLAFLYERRILLNFVAGDFPWDRASLGDDLPHDQRYERLCEYGEIIRRLTHGVAPINFDGRFFQVKGIQLAPPVPEGLRPAFTVSGSSDAGLQAAQRLGARALHYPRPVEAYTPNSIDARLRCGIRLGLVIGDTPAKAWDSANLAFPEDLEGGKIRDIATGLSDSQWVKELSNLQEPGNKHPYWLSPYKHYQSSCPFLVGDMDTVSSHLEGYLRVGFRTFLIEAPRTRDDSHLITEAFRVAKERLDA